MALGGVAEVALVGVAVKAVYLAVAAHGPSSDGYGIARAQGGIRQVCPCPVYEGWVRAISLVRHEKNGYPLPERDPRSGWGSW